MPGEDLTETLRPIFGQYYDDPNPVVLDEHRKRGAPDIADGHGRFCPGATKGRVAVSGTRPLAWQD